MEYYRNGEIKKLHVDFEPLRPKPKPVNAEPVHAKPYKRAVFQGACCDCCKDNRCFYLKYREYCTDDFLGKRDCKNYCEELRAFEERQRKLNIIGINGGRND